MKENCYYHPNIEKFCKCDFCEKDICSTCKMTICRSEVMQNITPFIWADQCGMRHDFTIKLGYFYYEVCPICYYETKINDLSIPIKLGKKTFISLLIFFLWSIILLPISLNSNFDHFTLFLFVMLIIMGIGLICQIGRYYYINRISHLKKIKEYQKEIKRYIMV